MDYINNILSRKPKKKVEKRRSGIASYSSSMESIPINLTWSDITVQAEVEREWISKTARALNLKYDDVVPKPKKILTRVTGFVEPGKVFAVLGPSGSGKTTLLNVLSVRSQNLGRLDVKGTVMGNGQHMTENFSMRKIGYVKQDDLFYKDITAGEHLEFYARLRMERSIPQDQRKIRIEEVMSQLGLIEISDNLIRNLSGGQRKRLSFAAELLTNPSVLMCDEPTRGLDSFMATTVVTTLRDLAWKGKSIIYTISHPTSEIYSMFDKVLLLGEGRCCYYGTASDALVYFRSQGYSCPPTFSPADYFSLILTVAPGDEQASKDRIQKLSNAYESSENAIKIRDRITRIQCLEYTGREVDMECSAQKASWWTQYKTLTWRSIKATIRDPATLKIRPITHLIMAIFLGMVYYKQGHNISNVLGALSILLIAVGGESSFALIQVLPEEIPVFMREYFNGLYRLDSYLLGRLTPLIPVEIVLKVTLTSIMYFMIDLREGADRFFICCGILILMSCVSLSFSMFVSSLNDNATIVLAITQLLMFTFIIFSGFFITLTSIPNYLVWLRYLSWFSYSNELLNINQWENISPDEFIHIDCSNMTISKNTNDVLLCLQNGNAILKSLGFSASNKYIDVVALFALFFGYLLLAYLVFLWRVSDPFRKKFNRPTPVPQN